MTDQPTDPRAALVGHAPEADQLTPSVLAIDESAVDRALRQASERADVLDSTLNPTPIPSALLVALLEASGHDPDECIGMESTGTSVTFTVMTRGADGKFIATESEDGEGFEAVTVQYTHPIAWGA